AASTVARSNGRDFLIYFTNTKSTQHFTLGKNSPVDGAISAMNTALNLENAERIFQISGSKLDRGYELQLLPRTPSTKRIFQQFTLRLSADLFVERTEMLKPNGDKVTDTYSNQNRAPIPAATFEFTPPAANPTSATLGR